MSANSRVLGRGFRRSDRGAAAVEFALIFPLLLALSFGLIEFGLVVYQMNMMEKATQIGVRKAVTSDPVSPSIATYSASETGIGPGLPLPPTLELEVICTDVGCTGTGAITSPSYSSEAFTAIVTAMESMYPGIDPENVEVAYRHVGLGFVGRPGGAVVPAVTVSLRDMTYDFVLIDVAVELLSAGTFDIDEIVYPSFRATLTGEDLSDGA